MIEEFVDDDGGYLRWLSANPAGFVVNAYRRPTPDYLVLHAATCRTIFGTPTRGRRWTADYLKACSPDRSDLERWAREVGGHLHPCGRCRPYRLGGSRSSQTVAIVH